MTVLRLFSLILGLLTLKAWAVPTKPTGPSVQCEYLLHEPADVAIAHSRIWQALTHFKNIETYYVSEEARLPALARIGLDDLDKNLRSQATLRVFGPDFDNPKELRILRLDDPQGIFLERLSFPPGLLPIFAWEELTVPPRIFDFWLETEKHNSTYTLVPSNLEPLELGLLLEEDPNGRLMLSVRRTRVFYHYTLYLDVDCNRWVEYSNSRVIHRVRTEEGWLCRMPLMMAVASITGPDHH